MSDTLIRPLFSGQVRRLFPFAIPLGRRIVAVLISYEALAYLLAAVQATGLSMPAMLPAQSVHSELALRNVRHLVTMEGLELMQGSPNIIVGPGLYGAMASILDARSVPGYTFEFVPTGAAVQIDDGSTVVVPSNRLAVRWRSRDGVASAVELSLPIR